MFDDVSVMCSKDFAKKVKVLWKENKISSR